MTATSQGVKQKCIVCETPGAAYHAAVVYDLWDCTWRCGRFGLGREATANLPGRLNESPSYRSVLSHAIRRMQTPETEAPLVLTDAAIESILANQRLPTPSELADRLILWIGDNQPSPQQPARGQLPVVEAWIGSRVTDPPQQGQGLMWLLANLANQDLFFSGATPARRICFRAEFQWLAKVRRVASKKSGHQSCIHGPEIWSERD